MESSRNVQSSQDECQSMSARAATGEDEVESGGGKNQEGED